MKHLLDLRPCDNCGGPLKQIFHVVRTSLAMVDVRAVNEFMGMHQFFGGKAGAALVDNFSPRAATAVTVASDKEPSLMTELVICPECFMDKPLDMALLVEAANEREKRKAANAT